MNKPFTVEMAATVKRQECERIMALLTKYGVIRHSMLGDDWLVIYTETGAKDVTRDRLEGKE